MVPNGNPISSVAADVSKIKGTGPLGTTIVPLFLSATPNVYTNSVAVGAAVPTNTFQSFNIIAVDSANNTNEFTYTLNIVSGYPSITASASPNPVIRGPATTTTVTATVTARSYPVGTVTVSGSGIDGSPITLVSSNSTSVYTNSATIDPLAVTGPLTVTVVDAGNETSTATINLTVNSTDIWVGDNVNNLWDNADAGNHIWTSGVAAISFVNGDQAVFNDAGSASPAVTLNSAVSPGSLVVSNLTKNYIFTGSGGIGGTTGLTKTNGGILTLLSTNSYTGPTIIGGGVLELETGALLSSGSASPIGAATSDPSNLVFYGSTLRYSGMDVSNGMDHGMMVVSGVKVDVTNVGTAFTEYGLMTGSGGLTKVGNGTFVLQNVNSYVGGTVISNGILALGFNNANWNGATGSGVGPTTNSVTFMGTGTNAVLQLYGWLGYSNYLTAFNNFYNPLVVPTGQAGMLELPGRGNPATGAGAGLNSSLTGGGTITLVANYVRYPLSGNWSAFTGLINVTGAGFPNANNNTVGAVTANIDEFRINNTNGYANAAIYLAGDPNGDFNSPPSTLLMCQTVGSGATINIGELGGDITAVIGTGTASAGNTTWRVGWKNTTNTFYGMIANDAQAGVGVTSITKVGTGEWILAGQNTYSGSTSISNGVLALIRNPLSGNDGSIANSANVFINTGAVLDISGLSTPVLTLNSGQTVAGGGTLNGSVSATRGAIIPGSTNAIGALTITGGLTESGANNNFQLSTVGNSDLVKVQGTLDVSSGIQNISLSGFNGGTINPGVYPLFTYAGGLNGPMQFSRELWGVRLQRHNYQHNHHDAAGNCSDRRRALAGFNQSGLER